MFVSSEAIWECWFFNMPFVIVLISFSKCMFNRGNRSSNVLVESSILGFQGKEIGWPSRSDKDSWQLLVKLQAIWASNVSVQVGGRCLGSSKLAGLIWAVSYYLPELLDEILLWIPIRALLDLFDLQRSEDLRIKFMLFFLHSREKPWCFLTSM